LQQLFLLQKVAYNELTNTKLIKRTRRVSIC